MRNIFKMSSTGIPCDGGFYECKVITDKEKKPKGWHYTLDEALKAGKKKAIVEDTKPDILDS